jgi:uncharacterized protein YdaU (DUF1376 family)
MRNGLPYYKAYPRDFIEGTIGMPFEVKCAYRVILDLIYMQGGNLPDDARYISGLLGCSMRKWTSIREALVGMGKLVASEGSLSNYRADKEIETLSKLQDIQRENASGPRKNKDLQKPPLRQPEPDTEEEKREAKASPKKTRGSRLSADWFLPVEWGQWAMAEGMGRDQIRAEADRFKDYWLARAGPESVKMDWQATWRNWIRKALENGNRNATSQGGKRPDAALEQIARLAGIGASPGDGRGRTRGSGEEDGPFRMGT